MRDIVWLYLGYSQNWIDECRKYRGKVLHGIDCHWCNDWDGLPVSAFTEEYGCCLDQSLLGKICHWFWKQWMNNGRTE